MSTLHINVDTATITNLRNTHGMSYVDAARCLDLHARRIAIDRARTQEGISVQDKLDMILAILDEEAAREIAARRFPEIPDATFAPANDSGEDDAVPVDPA